MKVADFLKLIIFTIISMIVFNVKLNAEEEPSMFIDGESFNIKLKQLAGDDTTEKYVETVNTNIIYIKRSNTLDITPTEDNIVSVEDSFKPIYAWFDAESETIFYYSESEILYLNEDSSYLFVYLTALKDVELETINTSNVIEMDYMFTFCNSL